MRIPGRRTEVRSPHAGKHNIQEGIAVQFDYEIILIAAMLVIAPALFAVMSVRRHVSKFIRDVELEERENEERRKKD